MHRRLQAVDRLNEIIHQDWLPRRDRYILDFSQREELESELASAIVVSSDSEGEVQVVEAENPLASAPVSTSASSRVPRPPPYRPSRVPKQPLFRHLGSSNASGELQ